MKLFRYISVFTLSLASVNSADVATEGREMTPDEMAKYDIGLGIAGVKQAASDPAMLAQLMKDLQDPELMAEAKKMMEGKEFKENMKNLEKSPEFKESIKKTKEALKDPATQGKMEATLEHMLKVGNEKLDNVDQGINKALGALEDPDILAKTAQMMAQPDFKENLAKMMQNPGYMSAMQKVRM
mmetsp:Transcript_4615/g.8990  ORF Transcript_4615/g.8990 Transcript_4615/m.8990 type:complete len:184 (-) Transcript_4615:129-680(-)